MNVIFLEPAIEEQEIAISYYNYQHQGLVKKAEVRRQSQ